MKNKVGFPKLCANETLLNEYYKDVSTVDATLERV